MGRAWRQRRPMPTPWRHCGMSQRSGLAHVVMAASSGGAAEPPGKAMLEASEAELVSHSSYLCLDKNGQAEMLTHLGTRERERETLVGRSRFGATASGC